MVQQIIPDWLSLDASTSQTGGQRKLRGCGLRLQLKLAFLPISDVADLIDTLRSHRFVTDPEGIEIDGNICGCGAKHNNDQNRDQFRLYFAIHSCRLSWWTPPPRLRDCTTAARPCANGVPGIAKSRIHRKVSKTVSVGSGENLPDALRRQCGLALNLFSRNP